MSFAPGDKLGPYEILGLLGKGGMGEVYRAHDDRLRRDVAIKVSNAQFTERFTREARTVASLNHTNIAHLYDVGPNYLVMELVEGEDLKGPLSFDDALPILRQLIDGIEAAHDKGIVHRDLKPANIKVTPEGVVKILDFGLAKAMDPISSDADPGNSPTLTMGATVAGTILGTAAYMAPEQAKGKTADRRSDIWSFGVIVYELLTGQRLFQGESTVEILGGVLNKEPDLSAAPAQAQKLLRWCLERDRQQRLASISDARRLLTEGTPQPVTPTSAPQSSKLPWIAAAVAILTAALALWAPWRTAPVEPPLHLNVELPPDITPSFMQLSPDGTRLLAIWGPAIHIRRLDSPEWHELVDPGGRGPFWSPDSRFIAFFSGGKLKKISAAGGPVQELCQETGPVSAGAWSRDGVIVFTTADNKLRRVSQDGGACQPVWKDDPNVSFSFLTFLPDGNHLLFRRQTVGDPSSNGVYMAALNDPAPHRVLQDSSSTVYVPASGGALAHILFYRGTALMAQPFDEGRLQPSGDAFEITSQVALNGNAQVMASWGSGTLTYMSGRTREFQLTWYDRAGQKLGTVGPLVEQSGVRISPDGKSALTSRLDGDKASPWIYDLERGSDTRLLPAGSDTRVPLWFPQGRRLLFRMAGPKGSGLYQADVDAGGEPQFVAPLGSDFSAVSLSDFSRDGQYLIFTKNDPKTAADIAYLKWNEKPDLSQAQSFLATGSDEGQARLSPDGKWVAYTLGVSGNPRTSVWIRPFPSGSGVWRVAEGQEPRWSADGRLLYFTSKPALTGNDVAVFETAFMPDGNAVHTGPPRELFRFPARVYVLINEQPVYAPHPDGKRFLVNALPPPAPPAIHVLPHWRPAAPK